MKENFWWVLKDAPLLSEVFPVSTCAISFEKLTRMLKKQKHSYVYKRENFFSTVLLSSGLDYFENSKETYPQV